MFMIIGKNVSANLRRHLHGRKHRIFILVDFNDDDDYDHDLFVHRDTETQSFVFLKTF